MHRIRIRTALPAEYPAVGELTAASYLADGHVDAASPYLAPLRDAAARGAGGDLLVADAGDRLAGTVTLAQAGEAMAELAGAGEAELRMLAVAPQFRGAGLGWTLVAEALRRARDARAGVVRLSTGDRMVAARHIYTGLGFRRSPERDWSPQPGIQLITYALDLTAMWCDRCGRALAEAGHQPCAEAELEPPRWCGTCGRRVVVQITPGGWSARCVEHGTRVGATATSAAQPARPALDEGGRS